MKSGKLLLGAIVGLATLTACGGGGANQAAGNPPPAESGAVSVRAVDGVGQTLVDSAGKTLYFADQEAGGTIKCTAGCLSFWMPVAGSADAAKEMPGLGVVKRSDTGNDQLTFQGKPLYTFKLDTAAGARQGKQRAGRVRRHRLHLARGDHHGRSADAGAVIHGWWGLRLLAGEQRGEAAAGDGLGVDRLECLVELGAIGQSGCLGQRVDREAVVMSSTRWAGTVVRGLAG